MKNIVSSEEKKNFYVWINPKDMYVMHNARIGSFVSVTSKEDNLMFLPNPKFSGYISPFQENLLKSYLTEFSLETERKKNFQEYPSRLVSTFLFDTEESALQYKETHPTHVMDRELRKGVTSGTYIYSKHDLGWIDYLRSPFILDQEVQNKVATNYWKGNSVKDFSLTIPGHPLKVVSSSIYEVLFLGRIDFER